MIAFWLSCIFLFSVTLPYFYSQRAVLELSRSTGQSLHSRLFYYGAFSGLCALVLLSLVTFLWYVFEPLFLYQLMLSEIVALGLPLPEELLFIKLRNMSDGLLPVSAELEPLVRALTGLRDNSDRLLILSLTVCGVLSFLFTQKKMQPAFQARIVVERFVVSLLWSAAFVAVFTTGGIVLSLLFESLRFFERIPVGDFLFGLKWSPQMAIREDQVAASGAFGAIPVFAGTILVASVAMSVALPIGLFSAIYLSEYASKFQRTVLKPLLEVLAGIPTVVYGFFAALTVAPFLKDFGASLGLSVAAESALAAGVVMGVMIIPFVSSLSDDVIRAVPQTLRDASLALGATRAETITRVVLPAALPGIVGAFLLAVSRAIGETMIVVMAAGLAANLTINPLESVTTVTVQIVTILVGDQEFDSAKTLVAFALGLVLFFVTLCLNVVALYVVRRYREKYE